MPLFNLRDYEYDSLPSPTSIRLLRLHYSYDAVLPSLCGYPMIHCRLETFDLRDNPQYEALSYTWESPLSEMQKRATDTWTDEYGPLSKWPINMNHRLLFVRKNLFDALRHLQSMQNVDRKDPRDYNKTELHKAAENGDEDQVRKLLLQGASCGARDSFGETPLHYAAENGHVQVVKLLVASGAEMGSYDNWGRQPIHCCTQRKRGEWAKVAKILRDPVRNNAKTGASGDAGHDYYQAGDLEARGEYDKTPLISAAEDGDLRLVRDLAYRGADLMATDRFGETALHYAAENGHYEIVVELLLESSSVNVMLTKKDGSGRTPLDCCTQQRRGNHEQVAALLGNTQSLQAELQSLREARLKPSANSSETTYFWIDAICINQSDLDERSAQVQIMPDIYRQASSVIVWLGVDKELKQQIDNKNCDVSQIMRRVNKKANKLEKLRRQWSVSLQSFIVDVISDSKIPEGGILSIDELKVIIRIFLRAWFSRAWVVQELALARKIRMFLGDEELDWHQLLRFLFLLAHCGLFHTSAFWKIDRDYIGVGSKGGDGSEAWKLLEVRLRTADDPKEWEIIESIQQRDDFNTPRIHRGKRRLSLPLLLANCWSFESKDPRDKIFALLNLATPLREEDQIYIDYKLPVEELYTHVAHIFLRGASEEAIYAEESLDYAFDGMLEPLEGFSFIQDPFYSNHQARMPKLPTWVPDFSNALTTSRI
ncbi:ankyrin repeat-containing domain protein [Stachybotrys elegans]|uniref:Ankyrin repeat-containing domain protein n=1 Tax=Stachybotrys elegans TaxID=80388 RepID=A0A8K0SGB4_9HYPO|nr:ankyrin repeat-containing domain protein [Stachybotrys elegans]